MSKKRKKLKKLCAFCLRPVQMSGEHLWSAWIGKLFADYKGVYSFRTGISVFTYVAGVPCASTDGDSFLSSHNTRIGRELQFHYGPALVCRLSGPQWSIWMTNL